MNNQVLLNFNVDKYYELGLDELNYNLLYNPDITIFTKFKNIKDILIFQKKSMNILLKIHTIKPKIHINKNEIFSTKTKYYISMIQKLYKIGKTESTQN